MCLTAVTPAKITTRQSTPARAEKKLKRGSILKPQFILELLSPKAGISSEIKIIVLNQSFSAHDTSCIWPSAVPDQFPLSEAAAAGLAVNLFIKGYFSCWLRNAMQYSWGILFNY
jgi:hypothetical protein